MGLSEGVCWDSDLLLFFAVCFAASLVFATLHWATEGKAENLGGEGITKGWTKEQQVLVKAARLPTAVGHTRFPKDDEFSF